MRTAPIAIVLLFAACMLYAQGPRLVLPIGHTSLVDFATYSVDGKFIATTSWDKTAKIWNSSNGKLLVELKGHSGFVNAADFSNDGKMIATASSDHTARIWNVADGKLRLELIGHSSVVESAKFSLDGKTIITSSADKTVKTWSAKTGKLISDWTEEKMHIVGVSSDGKTVVTSFNNYSGVCPVKIWNISTRRLVQEFVGHTRFVNYASFSPDGTYLITTSTDSTAKIWNIAKGTLVIEFKSASYYSFKSAEFSPDGKNIVTTEGNEETKIWNAEDGKLITTLNASKDVLFAAYSPDGKNIVGAGSLAAKIWKVPRGELVTEFTGNTSNVFSSVYSPDEKYIVTAYGTGKRISPKIWNAQAGNLFSEFNSEIFWGLNTAFSPDGKNLIISGGKTPTIWNFDERKFLQTLNSQSPWIYNSTYSPDGKYITTANEDKIAEIWDVASGSCIRKLLGHTKWVLNSSFSPNNKYVVTSSADSTARIWDVDSENCILELKGHTGNVNSAQFSPNGKQIITASEDNTAKIWDSENGTLFRDLKGHNSWVNSAVYSPDGKNIATASWDGTIKVWDATDGHLLHSFNGKGGNVSSVMFSIDNKFILASYADNTTKIWNFKKGQLTYTFCLVNSLDYIGYLPSGYYQCSPNAAKLLHYVTSDLKIITFEQLDVKYNRPDKVLEAIGNTDTALINSYKRAYMKRIKKLGIDTSQFKEGYSLPEAIIANSENIKHEQNTDVTALHITAVDSTYLLDRFNIWVNDVPVFGLKGISIRSRQKHSFDTTISIKLSKGDNRIETSILNVNGTESYRSPLIVKYTPAVSIQEKVHFIGIGINQFSNADYKLSWSVKDIRDLALKLKEHYNEAISIDTLFDEKVSRENVLALKKHLLSLGENDKVIVSYSGHGVLSKDMDYFLSTYNISFEQPEQFGLPYDDLESLLDGIRPRKKLMFIDACHSGEVDKDEIARIETVAQKLDSNGISHKSRINIVPKKTLGMNNSFELMQNLFVNVGKSTGATIISAAGGMQYAQERGDLKNGVFTYSILEAFNENKTLTVSQLKKIVGERVTTLTNGLQKPTSRNETINVDWNVW